MALDYREQIFVSAYIKHGEAYPAAIEAGYKHSTAKYAYEWLLETLPNPTVKRHLPYKKEIYQAIEKRIEEIDDEKIADAKEILEYLTRVIRKDSLSCILCKQKDGSETVIEKPPDEKERLKAAELLGKRYGLFTERFEQDIDMQLNITVNYGDE